MSDQSELGYSGKGAGCRIQNETEPDLLITGGTCLTMDDRLTVIDDALIGIQQGRIAFVQEACGSQPIRARRTINAARCLILPGLINTHVHAPMVCFRGMADDLPLMDWLNRHIFPAEAKYVDKEMVYYGTMLAAAEMILSGTTTFADGYFLEDEIARAAVDSGMRAVTAEGFIDFSPPDEKAVKKHLRKAEAFVGRWKDVSDRVTPAVFCHSPYSCAAVTLRRLKEFADDAGSPYFIHVSETRDEVEKITAREGERPVSYLRTLGVLDEKTVAVHCIWIDDREIAVLAEHGVKVAHTPESNMKLACGIAPVPKMLKAGVTVGLGTDGAASNNNLDMFGEMNMAAKAHKLAMLDPTVMDCVTVLWMATRGGARALGIEDRTGSIEKGKQADLIILDTNQVHLTPIYNPYSHLVYAASGADVKTSIIDGKIVMLDRKIMNWDPAESMANVNQIAGKIRIDLSAGR